MLLERL